MLNSQLEVQTFGTVIRPCPEDENTIAAGANSRAGASTDILVEHHTRRSTSFASRLPDPYDTANARYELEGRVGSQATGRDEVHYSYLWWKLLSTHLRSV